MQLRRLTHLRTLTIAAQLLTLLCVWKILELDLQWLPMLICIASLAAINSLTLLRLKSGRPVASAELFSQLCIDVFAFSILLYFSGGSTNPFVSIYLLPLVIAAATLPARYTWGMAALTTACYSFLMIYRIPLPHAAMDMGEDFSPHVMGMWLGFVISAVVVAYFVVKMAQALRTRDELLAQVREEILRNERIVALGTQAAGAAHELGTPLSTMAVVIGELQHDALLPEAKDSLELLDEQVRGCRRILDKMLSSAQHSGSIAPQAADQMIAEVLNEWQLLRPTANCRYRPREDAPAPTISVDVTLRAALMNLLNNAADASPGEIELSWRRDGANFLLEIRDYGAGLSQDVAQQAGSAFFTTKEDGRGLGLFLANATIERMRGSVRLYNREGGGATTELTLPIVGDATGAAS